jgi:hypothetical protein
MERLRERFRIAGVQDRSVDDAVPAPAGAVGELRAVRRGGFTISRLHRSGSSPYRLLLVGSRAAVGAGRPSADDRWFAEHLADRAWLQLRRGVDLDVLWELRPVLSALRRSVNPWRLWRYDVVIIVLTATPGVAAALRLLGVGPLVREAVERIARLSAVLLVAVEPRTFGRSLRIERLTDSTASGGDADGGRRAVKTLTLPRDYREGADRIAQELVASAAEAAPEAPRQPSRDAALDEEARLGALAELGLSTRPAAPELGRLVRSVRAAFDVDLAAVNVIERDRTVNIAASGTTSRTDLPRALALCDAAITSRDAVLIEDTWADPDVAANPLLHRDPPIRFFAAYPLESLEGHRIGALCVYDSVPRSALDIDLAMLRDFALLVEATIAPPPR